MDIFRIKKEKLDLETEHARLKAELILWIKAVDKYAANPMYNYCIPFIQYLKGGDEHG